MKREKQPLSESEFQILCETFFSRANPELASFGERVVAFFWSLDQFAVVQDWESKPARSIVFGVPVANRRQLNAKNYLSVWRPLDSNERLLKCEIIFPKNSQRQSLLVRHDPKRILGISSINEVEGLFAPTDEDYLKGLALVVRELRMK